MTDQAIRERVTMLMDGRVGYLLAGVREHTEGYGVELVRHDATGGRLSIRARNEGGNNETLVDLWDVVDWLVGTGEEAQHESVEGETIDNAPVRDDSGQLYWDTHIESQADDTDVFVAYREGGRISLSVFLNYGDDGARADLSPEQAIEAGQALIRAGTLGQIEVAKRVGP